MNRSNVVQSLIVLGAASLVVLFVVRERLADWMSPPHFPAQAKSAVEDDPWVYVCPMDGFTRSEPGPCAIPACGGMPLTEEHRVRKSQVHRQNQLNLTSRQVQMIGLRTTMVEERDLVKEIRAAGKISADERLTRDVTARVEGRLEHVFKNFVGATVKEGEPLARIYSPDLVATQEELLIALRSKDERGAQAARKRLILWGIDEPQIDQVVKAGKAETQLIFPSPASGVVSQLSTHHGHWVKEGDHIMEVVDLSSVWVQADVYEYEIPFLRLDQEVLVTAPAFPGETFKGRVSYLHAFLDEKTRTLHLRVDVPNPERRLLPGMFVNAALRVPLGPGGVPLGPKGEFEVDEYFCHLHGPAEDPAKCPTCGGRMDVRKAKKTVEKETTVYVCGPCCPDVRMDKAGKCPKCPMMLKEKKEKVAPRPLAVPRSAVLDSGSRQHVFVEVGQGRYERREVDLGPLAGDSYPVRQGLKKGESVVSAAAWLLDSQTQISGGASALYSGSTEVKEEKGHKH